MQESEGQDKRRSVLTCRRVAAEAGSSSWPSLAVCSLLPSSHLAGEVVSRMRVETVEVSQCTT